MIIVSSYKSLPKLPKLWDIPQKQSAMITGNKMLLTAEAIFRREGVQRHIRIDDLKVRGWTKTGYNVIKSWQRVQMSVYFSTAGKTSLEMAEHTVHFLPSQACLIVRRHLLFPLCTPILKPCFNLSVCEMKPLGQIVSFRDCQIFLVVKLFLQRF